MELQNIGKLEKSVLREVQEMVSGLSKQYTDWKLIKKLQYICQKSDNSKDNINRPIFKIVENQLIKLGLTSIKDRNELEDLVEVCVKYIISSYQDELEVEKYSQSYEDQRDIELNKIVELVIHPSEVKVASVSLEEVLKESGSLVPPISVEFSGKVPIDKKNVALQEDEKGNSIVEFPIDQSKPLPPFTKYNVSCDPNHPYNYTFLNKSKLTIGVGCSSINFHRSQKKKGEDI